MVVEMVRVALPVPPAVRVTLPGLNEAVGPPVTWGETVAERVTMPANPLVLVRVTVDVPVWPSAMVGVLGFAAMVKSTTSTDIPTEWESVPLVPVMLTVYVWGGVRPVVEIVRVEVPVLPAVRVTLPGLNEAVGPPVTWGETVAERVTMPANPLVLVRVRVDVPVCPT
jgi:hypothetical protein